MCLFVLCVFLLGTIGGDYKDSELGIRILGYSGMGKVSWKTFSGTD